MSRPVPTTATVVFLAIIAPICAYASIPLARPLIIFILLFAKL